MAEDMDDVCEMVCRISDRVSKLWRIIVEELRPWRYLNNNSKYYSWDLAKKIEEELNRLNDELSSIIEKHPEIAKKLDMAHIFSDIQTCLDYVNLPTKKDLKSELEDSIKVGMNLVYIVTGESIVLILSTLFMLKTVSWKVVVGALILIGSLTILLVVLRDIYSTLLDRPLTDLR